MSITQPTRYDEEFPRPAPQPPPFWAEPPAPAPVTCDVDAGFWVATPAGMQHAVCALHLTPMLSQTRHEGGRTLDLAPEPGTACGAVWP